MRAEVQMIAPLPPNDSSERQITNFARKALNQ